MTVYFPYQYKFITILYPNKLHQQIRSDDNIDWKPIVTNRWTKIVGTKYIVNIKYLKIDIIYSWGIFWPKKFLWIHDQNTVNLTNKFVQNGFSRIHNFAENSYLVSLVKLASKQSLFKKIFFKTQKHFVCIQICK